MIRGIGPKSSRFKILLTYIYIHTYYIYIYIYLNASSKFMYSPHRKSFHMIRLSFDDRSLFIRVLFSIIWYIVPVQSNSHADANIFRLQELVQE